MILLKICQCKNLCLKPYRFILFVNNFYLNFVVVSKIFSIPSTQSFNVSMDQGKRPCLSSSFDLYSNSIYRKLSEVKVGPCINDFLHHVSKLSVQYIIGNISILA
jgi:hypothetical protein